jgi:hypothetical protein
MPFFKGVLINATDKNFSKLRGKSMEAISLVAVAVGLEVFSKDAKEILDTLLVIQCSSPRFGFSNLRSGTFGRTTNSVPSTSLGAIVQSAGQRFCSLPSRACASTVALGTASSGLESGFEQRSAFFGRRNLEAFDL